MSADRLSSTSGSSADSPFGGTSRHLARIESDSDSDSWVETRTKRVARLSESSDCSEDSVMFRAKKAARIETSSDSSDAPESDSSDGTSDKCPICLMSLNRRQELANPESCDHLFCLECLLEWSKTINTCPADRQEYRMVLVRKRAGGKVCRRIVIDKPNADNTFQIEEDPTYCEICGQDNREDEMLLCDGCDSGYHMDCLTPALEQVPEGAWYCAECAPQPGRLAADFAILNWLFDQAENTTRNLVNLRRTPRTGRTERVRRQIATNRRRAENARAPAEREANPPDRPRRRPKKRRRKARYRTVYTINEATGETIAIKKRIKRRRKKRKTRRVKTEPATTVRKRLARHLGMCAPKIPEQILPDVKIPNSGANSMASQRYQAGIQNLDLFGNREELDFWEDGEDDGDYGEVLSRRRPNSHDAALLRRSRTKAAITVPTVTSTSGDLLDSILDSQSKFHSKSSVLSLKDNGSISVEDRGRHSRESLVNSGGTSGDARKQSSSEVGVNTEEHFGDDVNSRENIPNFTANNSSQNDMSTDLGEDNSNIDASKSIVNLGRNQNFGRGQPRFGGNRSNFGGNSGGRGNRSGFGGNYANSSGNFPNSGGNFSNPGGSNTNYGPNMNFAQDVNFDTNFPPNSGNNRRNFGKRNPFTRYRPNFADYQRSMSKQPQHGNRADDNPIYNRPSTSEDLRIGSTSTAETNWGPSSTSAQANAHLGAGYSGSQYGGGYDQVQYGAGEDMMRPISAEDRNNSGSEVDIYSDIETVTTSKADNFAEDEPLPPPPLPPFDLGAIQSTSGTNVDNAESDDIDSEPDLYIDTQKQVDDEEEMGKPDEKTQLEEEAVTSSTVNIIQSIVIPAPEAIDESEMAVANVTSTSELEEEQQAVVQSTSETNDQRAEREKEEDRRHWDDDEQDGCPNFTIYSTESKNLAKDIANALDNDANDQVGEVSSSPDEQQTIGSTPPPIALEDDNKIESGQAEVDTNEHELPEAVEEEKESIEENKSPSTSDVPNKSRSNSPVEENKRRSMSPDDDINKTRSKSPENIGNKSRSKSPDEIRNKSRSRSPDDAANEIASKESEENKSVSFDNRRISSISAPFTSENNRASIGGLYSDSEDESVVKMQAFGANLMTEEIISEEERSLTPKRAEQSRSVEDLGTEMISDDCNEDFEPQTPSTSANNNSTLKATASSATDVDDALEINAKENELDLMKPDDYEEGEIVDKAKKTADNAKETEIREETQLVSKTDHQSDNKENELSAKEKSRKDSGFKKLKRSNKNRNYRKDKERNNRSGSRDKQSDDKYKKKNKRTEIERYNVRALVADKPRRDEFGRDLRRSSSRSDEDMCNLSPSRSPVRSNPSPPSRSPVARSSPFRRRNQSPSPARRRNVSTPLGRRRSRTRTPVGRRRSPSPMIVRRRSQSRDRRSPIGRRRSPSPMIVRHRSRSHSIVRRRSISHSPIGRRRTRSPSIVRRRSRSPSIGRRRQRRNKKRRRQSRSPVLARRRKRRKSMTKRNKSPELVLRPAPRQKSPGKSPNDVLTRRTRRSSSPARGEWRLSPWSRSRSPLDMRQQEQQQQQRTESPSWTPPRPLEQRNLRVYLQNEQAEQQRKKKKEKRKKTKEGERAKKKKRTSAVEASTPPPAKEVFASGDNILVSVSFNKSSDEEERTTRRRPSDDAAKKNKKPKKRVRRVTTKRARELASAKPVAIIDLERSPFKEITPSPKDIIVLSDSDNEQNTNANKTTTATSTSQTEPGVEQQGPKTPPEPQVKFTLASKPTQVRPMANPLAESAGDELDLIIEDGRQNDDVVVMETTTPATNHKGPNTPPDPPTSPPSSPDAYDPFEPTKSRSASPDDDVMMQTEDDRLRDELIEQPVAVVSATGNSSTDNKQMTASPERGTTTPPINTMMADIQPADSQSSLQVTSESSMGKSTPENNHLSVQTQTTPKSSSTTGQTISLSCAGPSIISSTAAVSLGSVLGISIPTSSSSSSASSRINIINSSVVQPPQQTQLQQQRLVLPNILNPVRISPNKTTAGSSKKNRNNAADMIEALGLDSPYSPGSSDYEDLFEPPASEANATAANTNTKKAAGRPAKSPTNRNTGGTGQPTTFDALFITSPYQKVKTKMPTTTPVKTVKKGKGSKYVGVKVDEDSLKILDELPNSAVEMQVKDKFLKKLNRQERVVEEVKLVLKPHYNKKHVNKDEYKDILRRAVPKICHNKSGEINPTKIKNLVEAYVRKVRHSKKVTSSSSAK